MCLKYEIFLPLIVHSFVDGSCNSHILGYPYSVSIERQRKTIYVEFNSDSVVCFSSHFSTIVINKIKTICRFFGNNKCLYFDESFSDILNPDFHIEIASDQINRVGGQANQFSITTSGCMVETPNPINKFSDKS